MYAINYHYSLKITDTSWKKITQSAQTNNAYRNVGG